MGGWASRCQSYYDPSLVLSDNGRRDSDAAYMYMYVRTYVRMYV